MLILDQRIAAIFAPYWIHIIHTQVILGLTTNRDIHTYTYNTFAHTHAPRSRFLFRERAIRYKSNGNSMVRIALLRAWIAFRIPRLSITAGGAWWRMMMMMNRSWLRERNKNDEGLHPGMDSFRGRSELRDGSGRSGRRQLRARIGFQNRRRTRFKCRREHRDNSSHGFSTESGARANAKAITAVETRARVFGDVYTRHRLYTRANARINSCRWYYARI